jgi:hypothetical protein
METMDLNKELLHLKELMEAGRIKLLKEMEEPLKNIKKNSDGTVVEETVSGSVRALLLAIKAAENNGKKVEKEEINEELLKKIMSLSKEQREKTFLSLPREKAAGYKEIYMRVMMLEDFYFILSNLPKESFKDMFNLSIKDIGGNPANALRDYIILEIRKFYELVSKKEIELPPVPEYWTKLKDFRDARIAHPSKASEYKLNEDVEKLYWTIDEIGFDKIMEDFKQYAKSCIDIVNESDT